MSKTLKLEISVADLGQNGVVISEFATTDYVANELSKKATLNVEGKVDPSLLPDYTYLDGLVDKLDDVEQSFLNSDAEILNAAKLYSDNKISENNSKKADLVEGKVPFEQLPFSMNFEQNVSTEFENVRQELRQNSESIVSQMEGLVGSANSYTDGKVLEEREFLNNTINEYKGEVNSQLNNFGNEIGVVKNTQDVIIKNGASLPYNPDLEYAEGALTLKDGELQQFVGGNWTPFKTNALNVVDTSGLSQQEWNNGVETIADLLAIQNPKNGSRVYVKSYYTPTNFALAQPYMGGGVFIYDSTRSVQNDSVVIFNGWCRQHNGSLDVTDGGAVPDINVAQHVEIKRTFESARWNNILKLTFRKGEYLVGVPGKTMGTLLDIWGVPGLDTNPQYNLHIDGCGATIKQVDGVWYGNFNGVNYTPFNNIINNSACHHLTIENLTIDGNKQNAIIGEKYGDHGWQIPNYGIRLISGRKNTLRNVKTINMLLDGLYVGKMGGSDNLRDDIIFENVHSEYNGRQGLSVCGVRGLTAIGCKFNYTGQDGLMSAPSAGIDFENELGSISDVTFINCEVRGNIGHDIHIFNLHSDFDIRNVNFYSSTIVAEGKTAYPFGVYDPDENKSAAIAFNPSIDFKFHNCLIGGKIMRENGGTNWQYEQTKMVELNGCTITNDETMLLRTLEVPKYSQIINTVSPDGTEYGLNLNNCRFKLKDQGVKIPRNGRINGCVFEASFTKKLTGHAFDFGTSSLYQNVFYTFDNAQFSNTVNFVNWDNTTNKLTSNDAPQALIWAKTLTTGLSGDISTSPVATLSSSSNINSAYTADNRVFEKRYILQGVNVSNTYPEVWGVAIFNHALNGDGSLVVYATNYNGVTLTRRRASNVWGDFTVL